MRLATFDIFDTALIRKCGKPEGVFYLTAARLWPESEECRADFVTRRLRAKGDTIEALYADMGFSDPAIMAAEMAVESEMLTANVAVVSEIERLRTEGWTIKFLSDMYLPSEFLADVLRREGCLKGAEEVIVSCEHGARKDTGTLYDAVRTKFSPEKWIHFGDNKRSDVKMARRKGVKATLISTDFTPIEKRLIKLSKCYRDNWSLSLLAGFSRAARLSMGNKPDCVMAADYVVPAILPYVIYVVNDARKRGLKRIQFLNRDGYIMFKMAECLCNDKKEWPEINYIFASRRSLMSAYLADATETEYMAIVDHHTLVRRDVDHMLWQLLTSRSEMADKYGTRFEYDKIVNKEQEKDFLNKIFRNDKFTHFWQAECKKARKIAHDYFEQEGIFDGKNAIVDIGWLGTSRLMMSRLTKEVDCQPILTYYMGTRRDVYPATNGDYVSYYTSGTLNTMATALLEGYFTVSPWPTTIGYKYDEGRIIPVFPESDEYCETDVVKANVAIAEKVATWLRDLLPIPDEILFAWSKETIESLAEMKDAVELSPLTKIEKSDFYKGMVSKLSFSDMIKCCFLGKNITGFDKGSLYFTLGKRGMRFAWKLHTLSARIKGIMYKRLIANQS